MANIKSAKKRISVIAKKTATNRRVKNHLKAVIKNFDKALAVYEKLCLKYPEKSSYFADQILKIKEQIK